MHLPQIPVRLSRRAFAGALFFSAFHRWALATGDDRVLALEIDADPFKAGVKDIRAVLLSAAGEIWKHCPNTHFQFGFHIYRNDKFPITHYAREKGRIVIGLCTGNTYWSQYAYQFAHEFCHALMDHSNEPQRLWTTEENANKWFEETLCEVGSLFALRAMARTWETAPPYPNWKSYAAKLAGYAADRMQDPKHQLPAGQTFAAWFTATEPEQRRKWTRENNTIIALRLLPHFEAEPAGWEALPSLLLCAREPQKPLARLLAEWKTNAPAGQRAFIEKIAGIFPVTG